MTYGVLWSCLSLTNSLCITVVWKRGKKFSHLSSMEERTSYRFWKISWKMTMTHFARLFQANAHDFLILHMHAPTRVDKFRINAVLSWERVSNAGSLPLTFKSLWNLHDLVWGLHLAILCTSLLLTCKLHIEEDSLWGDLRRFAPDPGGGRPDPGGCGAVIATCVTVLCAVDVKGKSSWSQALQAAITAVVARGLAHDAPAVHTG